MPLCYAICILPVLFKKQFTQKMKLLEIHVKLHEAEICIMKVFMKTGFDQPAKYGRG